MLDMDPVTLRTALAQLEQAKWAHAEWYENLLREIVCGLAFDLNDLAEDAHLKCQFGQWHRERAPQELRRQPAFAEIGLEHERFHRAAARLLREVGAAAPISRQDFEELLAGCSELRRKLDLFSGELEGALRNRDALTGAYDRAQMLPRLREWHELAKRQLHSCCIAFMDLDHFKQINDRYGHPVGDAVLVATVRCLGRSLRPYDQVFRYGGDEFLLCLPGTDLATGQKVIKRVGKSLAGRPLPGGDDGITVHVTASFGLALLDPGSDVEDSIARADQALLLAKTAGRNRAMSWDASVTTGVRLPCLQVSPRPQA